MAESHEMLLDVKLDLKDVKNDNCLKVNFFFIKKQLVSKYFNIVELKLATFFHCINNKFNVNIFGCLAKVKSERK